MRGRRQRHVDLRRLAVRELATPDQRVERVVVGEAVADDEPQRRRPGRHDRDGAQARHAAQRYLLSQDVARLISNGNYFPVGHRDRRWLRIAIARTVRRLRQETASLLSPRPRSPRSATLDRHGPLTPSELAARERIPAHRDAADREARGARAGRAYARSQGRPCEHALDLAGRTRADRRGAPGEHLVQRDASIAVVGRFPVLTIERITLRRDPIYHSTYTGKPPDEPAMLGVALNEVFVPLLQRQYPEIADFYLPPEGCSYRLAVCR